MAQTTMTLWVAFTLLLVLTVAGSSGDNCLDAKECCFYPPESREFNECCILHDCCPRDCHHYRKISCCFNRQSHPMGADVYYLPSQCCLKLVCGAKLSFEPPYLNATIVPVPIPTQKDCPIPPLEHCVKDNGIVVMDGSEWQETPCKVCRCENGNITCGVFNYVTCPPPPDPYCREIPTECCPIYDCPRPRVCVDSFGVEHNVNEVWVDPMDPCASISCTESGIVKHPLRCPYLPPPPHEYCFPATRPNQCCPTWECSSSLCVDGNGVKRDLGEIWDHPGGPCMLFLCTKEGPLQIPTLACSAMPPRPYPSCTAVMEDCCPTWNCTDCVDAAGVGHVVGETWTDPTNPCINQDCTPNGIQTMLPICIPQLPQPNEYCFEEIVECCPIWRCSYCVDNTGQRRSVGEDWTDPHNPCLFHSCTEDGTIVDAIMDCPRPPPPPHPDCIWVHEDNRCCGSWQCNGCTDKNGVRHPLGDVWNDPLNPSTHYLCTEDGITTFILKCPLPPPRPSPDCTLTNHQDCCPSWSCPSSGCPNPESVMHHCADVQLNCSTQNDCTPDRRCCPVKGCGNRCLTEMKPGTCPQSTIPLPLCDFPINICQVDQDCPFDLKCCWDCGSKCKQPIQPY